MEVTWHMDGREEKFRREMLSMGKALAELRSLIRQKRSKNLGHAKISYDELENLLDRIIKERYNAQL